MKKGGIKMTNVTEKINKASTSAGDSSNFPDIYGIQFDDLIFT